MPTWFGIELTTAFEQNSGIFLDPEATTPDAGLWYAGISIPVGRGLFIDERRSELRQAQLFQKMTEAERVLILNELFLKAGKAYWDWFSAYNTQLVFEEALLLAQTRYDAVKQGAALGDRPSIDTLEASIQLQTRSVSLQQAQLDFANAAAMVSVYLWADGTLPLELSEITVPQTATDMEGLRVSEGLRGQRDSLVTYHPMLRQYQLKIGQLDIERRLKKEQLKPVLNLKYNAISQPINGDPFAAYSPNNYTWGVEFGMPLFLRKERGSLQLAEVKIQEAQWEVMDKQAKIGFEATAALNDWATTEVQISQYRRIVNDYRGLLAGERQMFAAGESSLFLVNSREQSYISAQLTLISYLAKNRKAELTTAYALGILGQN